MSRLNLCLACGGMLLVLSGCDLMGPDDNLPPPVRHTSSAAPEEISIRGNRARTDPKVVVIDSNRHDVVTGVGNGTSGKGNTPPPGGDPNDIPAPSGDNSSDFSGALAGNSDFARGLRAISASETAEALSLKKTLVVWLLDKSSGSSGLRGQVTTGIPEVGREAIRKAKPNKNGVKSELSFAIVSYGSDVSIVTREPVVDLTQIANLLSGLGQEETATPLTFTAASKAAEEYLPYRTKGYEVIFAIVGNRNGNDWDKLDEVIPKLVRSAVSVYGIGDAIPFGRRQGEPADKIPVESFALERIDLGYPDRQSEADLTDSGYGPLGLERLCRKTRGRFFRIRPGDMSPGWRTGGDGTVDSEVLAKHAPDYVSEKEYQQLLSENKCRMALVNAAKVPYAEVMGAPRTMIFTRQANEATLANMVTNAQRGAADKSLDVDRIYNALAPGEADRAKLTGARWQAEFDLAMGRILAAKSRIDGYNSILAMIKQGKSFANPKSTSWVLHRSAGVSGSSVLDKAAKNAQMYLNRVIKEHPGTPWAALAERELAQQVGWELSEE